MAELVASKEAELGMRLGDSGMQEMAYQVLSQAILTKLTTY
jgi:hypothetical protein